MDCNFKQGFGEHLLSLLEERGLSQADLAKLTGIRASTISDWINGKYLPKQDKRLLIARALDVSPDRLYLGDDDGEPMIWEGSGKMVFGPSGEGALSLYLNNNVTPKTGNYIKDKYVELKELATSITDGIEDDGIALSKGDVNTLLELLRLEIEYRWRM
jgi:bifunctional S24 family peptidase/transcriptional regulator|nr:MAG TPA: helix-turn-helix domain protein [Caudoviricetes sp.]